MNVKKKLGDLATEQAPVDSDVKLPADIRTTIARGQEAFKKQSRSESTPVPDPSAKIITSVIDQSVQDRRDANLNARAQPTKGNRRQPPMIARLRAVLIVVDRLMAEGVPFGVGPSSKMNKAVREWLNDKAMRSPDPRKSRHKPITPTARAVEAGQSGRPTGSTRNGKSQTNAPGSGARVIEETQRKPRPRY